MPELEHDLVNVWRRRADRAREVRLVEEKVWDKNLLAYRGKLKPAEHVWSDEDIWVSVELVHSTIRSALPSLLYSNPQFRLTPKKPELNEQGEDISWEKAQSATLWLQHKWAECEANTHVRTAIISAFNDMGVCWFGFAADYADDEVRGVIAYDDAGNPIIEASTPQGLIPKLERGQFLLDENDDLIFDEDTELAVPHPGAIQREDFFIEWVSARSILVDPEGGNSYKNHRWVAHEWCRPLNGPDGIKNDPRIRPEIRAEIRPNARIDKHGELKTGMGEVEDVERTGRPEDEDDLRVTGFDVYDFVHGRYYSVADAHSEEENDFFLVDRKIPPGLEHGPFRFLKFNEDPGRFYQKTDTEGMAKLELEYNITRSQMATHRNQSRARYFEVVNQGFAGEDGGEVERTKFTSGHSGIVVKVKNPDGIVPARKDAIGNDFFAAIPTIKDDFREIAGQPGGADTVADADTATQASLLTAQADVRNNDRRDNLVAQFITELARGLLQVAAANVTQVQFVKVRKSEDDPFPFEFKQINPEDLAGEYDIEVAVGSTQPKNTQRHIQMLERMVLLISQNPVIATVEGLMERMFQAIDINDEKLIKQLRQLGEAMLGAAQGVPPGAGGEGGGQVLPDENANQNGAFPSAAGGAPTGALTN